MEAQPGRCQMNPAPSGSESALPRLPATKLAGPTTFARRSPAALTEQDSANLAMRLADPIIYKMSHQEFDEFQDRLYEIMGALYARNDLATLLQRLQDDRNIKILR